MKVYHQDVIIRQLNLYLQAKGRKLTLNPGYCHGLSLLWLHHMQQGTENAFYDMIQKIVNLPTQELLDIENDVEKFLSHIQWLQHSSQYEKDIHQMNIDKLIEMPRNLFISFIFNQTNLLKNINKMILENQIISLSGPNHSIGVYKRDKLYYLFDPNYDEGKAKEFTNLKDLEAEIIKCLFKNFKKPTNAMPLEISVLSEQKDEKANALETEIYSELAPKVKRTKKLNLNLFLACEGGNVQAAKYFLEAGANPNGWPQADCGAIHAAAKKGFADILELLLAHNSLVDALDGDGRTALYHSARRGYEKATRTLLKSGANPLKGDTLGLTPLYRALSEKEWETIALLLSYIEKPADICRRERELLNKYKKDILTEIKKSGPSLSLIEKNQLQMFVKEFYNEQIYILDHTMKIFKPYQAIEQKINKYNYQLRSRL